MAQRIEDYALIGDCETAALVGRDGSIDWLCWPRFDSGAVFSALLGTPDNGRWIISPAGTAARTSRRYHPDTLILETLFETPEGDVALIDFMPLRFEATGERDTSHLVRIVEGRRGSVAMRAEITLRFDYGAVIPWMSRLDPQTLLAIAGPDLVVLHATVPLRPTGLCHSGEFTVAAGEKVTFSIRYGPSYREPPAPVDPFLALEATTASWREWASRSRETGPYSEAVTRSAITLKALTYRPTGGIVAAPTTSLPEQLGGIRNWDYRFCWLRDATFTLLSLMTSGFHEEAAAWRGWLRRAVAGNPAQVQVLYGLAGERRLDEWEVPWLSGYEGAGPVRIGNAAAAQLQIDIYGEVMDALFQANITGLTKPHADWDLQLALIEHLENIWQEPDEGIWEVRGGRKHFTYSKVMAWVAFDRAIRSVEEFHVSGPVKRWREVRDRIHEEICRLGFSPKKNAFVQHYGSEELDASALLFPLVGFLPPTDPRIQSTIAAIEAELMEDGFVRRYRTEKTDDGLKGREGAFLACSFWLVDNLIMVGRREEAAALFDRLLSLCNDVGLLSEEFDPIAGRMVGNFPQAFSHVALINSAHNLFQSSRAHKPAEQRSDADKTVRA